MSESAPPRVEVGDLLVAAPVLLDPNFERSVVLLLDSDDDGALGVVLNRPSAVAVDEILPDWASRVAAPAVVFRGGPVSTDSALAVGASAVLDTGEHTEPVGFRRLYEEVGIVDLDTPTAILGPALTHLRIFAGYAGWGADQLDEEIRSGAWYVVPSVRGDVFGDDPLGLWTRVLRRQPGELAWVATRPGDPTMN
jgi:putative transcriptional regulator